MASVAELTSTDGVPVSLAGWSPRRATRSRSPTLRTNPSSRARPHSVYASLQNSSPQSRQLSAYRESSTVTRKFAGSRENAKRFIRSVIAFPYSSSTKSTVNASEQPPAVNTADATGQRPALSTSSTQNSQSSAAATMAATMTPAEAIRARRHSAMVGGPLSGLVSRPVLNENIRTASQASASSSSSDGSQFQASTSVVNEKPVVSGNGISVFVTLAEPLIYLQGFEQHDTHSQSTSMLRGHLRIQISRATKIKSVSLRFKGKARTEWPEGIPPKKSEYFEERQILNHVWTFFNAAFDSAENGTGADVVRSAKTTTATLTPLGFSKNDLSRSGHLNKTRQDARRSLQLGPSRSFGKGESTAQNVAQKGYRLFQPGEYLYNFELPIDCHLPETINVELGSVKYELEALVERSGAFRPNLVGTKEVVMIRSPSESSLEQVEPIAISRNWEDQLHYDIVISGKSFPLGSQIPIAFKLTPLAKVQCHRIKVYVTENIEYYCSNKRVHRLEPTRKIQLLEKRAEQESVSTYPGSTIRVISGGGVPYDKRAAAAAGAEISNGRSGNILGDLDGDHNVGPTEMEMNVQLPSCSDLKTNQKVPRIHFDTTYGNIQVHHWIKIVMRLSKPDPEDPNRRRHFEISIDSPFHVLSCQATLANTSLPAYSLPDNRDSSNRAMQCGCPNAREMQQAEHDRASPEAQVANILSFDTAPSRTLPVAASQSSTPASRPIHLLRNPSFNPPPFDADQAPPPLVTPPPQYDSIVTNGEGLADYFARLADEIGDADDDGEGNPRRMHLPLTPGGRVNRSMDERRTWVI